MAIFYDKEISFDTPSIKALVVSGVYLPHSKEGKLASSQVQGLIKWAQDRIKEDRIINKLHMSESKTSIFKEILAFFTFFSILSFFFHSFDSFACISCIR